MSASKSILREQRSPNLIASSSSPGPLAAFARFVATGVMASVGYGLLFLVMRALTDASDVVINLVATIVSTVLSSELHRRFTFRASGGGSIARGRGAGSGMAVIGLLANSLVLAGWNVLVPGAGDVSTLVVVYCVNGAVGLGNFLVLRRVLDGRSGCQFTPRRSPPAAGEPARPLVAVA